MWRAVKAKYHLLVTNTEEKQKELFSDLNFIHEIAKAELIPQAIKQFVAKWRTKYGEHKMMDYFEAEWATKKWSRGFSTVRSPIASLALQPCDSAPP